MLRIALAIGLLVTASGCVAARQMIHNGLTYATDSASDDPMRDKLGDAEFRAYRAEEQNLVGIDLDRQQR